CMVFPDADNAATAPIDHAIRVAERVRRRGGGWKRGDRTRLLPGILAIKPLIGEIREIHGAILHREGAAAVFMRASANVEGIGVIGRNEFSLPALINTIDEGSSLLLRLRLAPIDRLAFQCDLVKPNRSG